jgi:hypothetical protein
MITISGRFPIPERRLQYDIRERLDLNGEKGCYFFRGENGIGKTTFVEKILIPRLDAAKTHFLYIGQDIRLQLYTLRALLATLGLTVKGTDDLDLLKTWIENSQSARVFILDEFDKFFPDYGFIFDWSQAFVQTYIFITHSDRNRIPDKVAERYPTCDMRFELADESGPIKHVRLSGDVQARI